MVSFSATYYVSNAGSDTNNGLSEASSWKTLAKVNAVTLFVGDAVKFKCGDSWFGQLTPQRSTISYGAYGTGLKPVISGFQTITGWTNLGNGIYSAPTIALNSLNIVTVNNILTAKGRYPNTGYLSFESHLGTTSITDNQLTAIPNWTGAEIAVRSNAWTLQSRTISNHSNSTLIFSALSDDPINGYGYFFQNDLKTLDLLGDWCIKNGTFYMFFGTQNPTNFTVKAAAVDKLITTFGRANITFDGLNLIGANLEIINLLDSASTATYNKVTNCDIEYCLKGIYVQGRNATIENNHISNCIGYGIFANGTNNMIRNNTVENIGLPIGVEAFAETGFATGISSYGNYSTIEYNTIHNVGQSGIDFRGTNTSVNNNFINTFSAILTDAAGIYTANKTLTGSIIKDNIIVNGLCSLAGTTLTEAATVGIYLDEGVNSFTVSGNSVSNIDGFGIFLHGATTINLINNTVYNCSKYQFLMSPNTGTSIFSGINIINNIFVAKELGQYAFKFYSIQNDLNFGSANGNIYARPIADSLTFIIDNYKISTTTSNLSGWKTLSGFDSNSTKSPITIANTSQLQFEFNASKTAKNVSLDGPMMDIKGIKYAKSITLQPYKSVVLLKDLTVKTVYSTENISICEGMNYFSSTTSGKFMRKLTAVSGGDSIVTTYLTVIPKYSISEDIIITEGENYNGWIKSGKYSRTLKNILGCDSIITTNLTVKKALNQGGIVPLHYRAAWQGENGQNHMNIIVVSAILNDQILSPNDEVALYCGSICVGTSRLMQSINAIDKSTFLTITTSQNTDYQNGYTENDTIIVKIWDYKNKKESLAKTVTYRNNKTSWLTTGRYSPGETSVIEIVSYAENTQTIELKKGYNLMSTYIIAQNPNVSLITKSLVEQGNLIKMQDESDNSLEKSGSLGGWINNLGTIEKTEGYKIKVLNNCTFQITGRLIVLPFDIPLKSGWNIISYPRIDIVGAKAFIQSLIDENKLVKVQDEEGNSIENWGIFGGWVNGIGNFLPGKAYKVKMNDDAVLTLQQNYFKSAVILAKSEKTSYFSTSVEGNGFDHMNINIVGLHESGISVGDELAVFDGDLCIGTLKLTDDHLNIGSASLIASSSDDNNDQSGFTQGHSIRILAWNAQTMKESTVQTEIINGKMIFEKESSVLVKMNSLTTGDHTIKELLKINIFPNPCKNIVTVSLSMIPDIGSHIEIMDINAKVVVSREIINANERFYFDNQPSGLYIVKAIIGPKEFFNKLVISR